MNIYAGVILAFAMMLNVKHSDCDLVMNIEELDNIVNVKCTQEESQSICKDEFELLARCVEAEAGDQGYLGKVYVIDCILNRCDKWHQTITETIYQKHQFEVASNNRINTVKVTEETRQAIRDELKARTRYDILHFRMSYYHNFGEPVFKYKDHYFSK